MKTKMKKRASELFSGFFVFRVFSRLQSSLSSRENKNSPPPLIFFKTSKC